MTPPPARAADPRSTSRVALLARQGKFLVAEPFFGPGPRVVVTRDKRAGPGDLVVLGGGGNGRRGGSRRATVARKLGRPDVARDVIRALMLDRGLEGAFDPAVEREARQSASDGAEDPSGHALPGGERRDLRDLPTFTIDPITARDFDDAISAEAVGDGSWRIWVHIADVAAYVTPRSLVDREAYRRSTSVYVPAMVEPMLPRALSNEACSLVPGAPRATVTVEMIVGERGVRRASMYRSLILSDERLDYGRVDRIFAGTEAAAEPWGQPLAAARAASAALGEARRASEERSSSGRGRSALEVDSPEPQFSFDQDGNVVAAELSEHTESHRLIEHLMIAANEQVAKFLSEHRIPALYRVHERPEAPAVERLIDQLESLGVPTPPVPKNLTPQQAADIVGEASVMVSAWVRRTGRGGRALTSLVLRSLKQAYYDPRNLGHAGLALTHYCHFTSPIRRYPDLICHRALLSSIAGEPVPEASWVAGAGAWASKRERDAMTIERDADDVARCFLLERELFQSGDRDGAFEGEIVGLIGAGAFVAFGERLQYEGLLPVRRLHGDWWELNEQATMLIGTRNGGAMRLGDPVMVRVGRIDAPRGRVDLLPVDAPEE